jgi:hypothetical protein
MGTNIFKKPNFSRWGQQVSPKHRYPSTKLYTITSLKMAIWIMTTMRTSNIT